MTNLDEYINKRNISKQEINKMIDYQNNVREWYTQAQNNNKQYMCIIAENDSYYPMYFNSAKEMFRVISCYNCVNMYIVKSSEICKIDNCL